MQSSIKKRIYPASSKVTPVKATIYEPGMKNKSTVDLNLSKEKINYDVATESYPNESALPAAIRYANISSDSLDRHSNMQPMPRAPSITKVSKASQLSSSLSQSQEPSVAISASSVVTNPNSGEPSSLTEKLAIASTSEPIREQSRFDYVEYDLPFERSVNGVRRERTMTNGSVNSLASTSTHTFHTDSSHATSTIPTEPSNEDMCRQIKSLQHAEVSEKQKELKEELKGVKEIQRAVPKPCAIAVTAQPEPTIEAFTDKDGRVHYFDFARAKIRYFLYTTAVDKVDEMEDEKFKLSKLRHNAERLASDLDPLLDVIDAVREVIRWDKPIKTSVIATLYFYLLYANLLLPVSLLTMIFIISYYGVRRREAAHSLGLGCLVHDAAEEPRFSILTQRRIQEEKESKTSKLSVRRFLPGADDWWTEIQDHFLAFLQLQLKDTADLVEKLRNLVTWKNPRRTWEVVGLLAFGVVGISYVPPGLVLKSIGFFVGVELFLLLPLQLHFPRYRRMFSLMHLLLWDIPTDEEYRIQEYTRLSHQHDEIEFSSCGCGTQSQNSLGSTDTLGSDQVSDIVGLTGRSDALSNAAESSDSLDGTFAQADSPTNAVKDYSCDFNSKSGILHLYPSYLSFESSKLPTSVSIPYSKIVRLKKSNPRRFLLFKDHRLELALVSGEYLYFTGFSIYNRDDLFNTLAAMSSSKKLKWRVPGS